ncbi:CRTAC1 family protein [Seohaeicola saemankumensis]|nr:CRTAC1 family protein [Seohaeicola saemankumensis]MCA0869506.1 CRTAC1 family protein [Seohaeicola saemankumensis]
MRPELGALVLMIAAPAAAGPLFVPVEAPEHSYAGGWEHFVGGGLASFDCDGDGLPELYAAGGANPAQLLRNRSGDGAVRFEAATPPALALNGVTGAYPLDIDSDGYLDLAVLRVGENRLLRGGPDCRFAPFADLGFSSADHWSTAFSATWETGRTLPTLAFGNYVDRADPDGPFRACDVNHLYRPEAGGYGPPTPLEPGYCPLSMLFSDWGRRGRADLRLSNDRHYYVDGGEEQMWAMEDPPRLFGPDDGWQSHKLWGMGIAARDLDGDGRTEVMLSSMGDQRLQRRTDPTRPSYADVPYDLGTTAHRPYAGGDGRPSTGWHVAFGDVQNDGRDDIFIAKGNVEQMPGSAMDDPNNLLIARPDGRYAEAGARAGVASPHRGRGAVLADFDGDGRLDLAVVNRRAPLQIWRNVTPDSGSWIAVEPRQTGINTRAVGGWIEIDDGALTRIREITVGGGHAGGSAGPEHFGLGPAARIRLRVIWPDGTASDWTDHDANQTLILTR